ncbi:hypothetical protein Anas_08027 [Armadillidium nasatum]|uniref:Uncharacterized protein n=1 Tax=Armadillidium nasatum TaxID=96803 RepID=A0A5N5SPU8_9CRUS|nr:hypothetical protein Anas_08027 [Armadillidium nasatum]
MKNSEKRDPEIVPEPEVELQEPLEHATPKFGRRSKGEVNNNTLSPAKSDKEEVAECNISSPKGPKIKKRKSYDADDTHLDDINTIS